MLKIQGLIARDKGELAKMLSPQRHRGHREKNRAVDSLCVLRERDERAVDSLLQKKGNKKGPWENPEALDTSSRFCLFDGNFSIFDDDIVCVAVAKIFVDDDNAAYGHGVAHLG